MRLRSEDKHHLRKSADRKAHISPVSGTNARLPDLCFSICRFFQVVFILRAQPHAQSLFLFPIVFGINLIHFSMGRTTAPLAIERFGTKRAEFFGNGTENLLRISAPQWWPFKKGEMGSVKGETKSEKFGKGKCKLIAKCEFLAREV